MDIKQLHKKATQSAGKFVQGIHDNQWNTQSTCTDWTVTDVVNHLVNENLWVVPLLEGKTMEDVGDKFDGDLLGDNPVKVWEETSQVALNMVDNVPDIDQICHLSYADVACHEYLKQRIMDLTIHGWDIAKSTRQKDTLNSELVTFVYETFLPQEKELRDSGMFGKKIKISDSSDQQTKLLALLGRKR